MENIQCMRLNHAFACQNHAFACQNHAFACRKHPTDAFKNMPLHAHNPVFPLRPFGFFSKSPLILPFRTNVGPLLGPLVTPYEALWFLSKPILWGTSLLWWKTHCMHSMPAFAARGTPFVVFDQKQAFSSKTPKTGPNPQNPVFRYPPQNRPLEFAKKVKKPHFSIKRHQIPTEKTTFSTAW